MKTLTQRIWSQVEAVRSAHPLVHCITNYVTVNDCANALLAAGAAPVMAHAPEESAEITGGCQALVLNMGATEYYPSMYLSGEEALKKRIPMVLDPVGVGGSTYRRKEAFRMIDRLHPAVVRGNLSEIRALITDSRTARGVDNAEKERADSRFPEETACAVAAFAREKGTIVIASGTVDLLTDGNVTYALDNGSRFMSMITGAGCMSTALLGAFMGTERSFDAAFSCCCVMAIASELAEEAALSHDGGPGTFRCRLMDSLYLIREEDIVRRLRARLLSAYGGTVH